ncbi:Haloacid dehalogenase-like hydrolase domain-containing protein 3 [Smittium mucronatum]|uniref:Haloacid dehalogenase-like hydrolase domain-containing protein 3 n=1 Tax=Smittium mucronatum TaxID=133383 RepID=A0A1R0GUI1_9FUNG|nr:Haloacid dehalogenase-like hydrolase domain-containing protein 3 [Smittium mucronatum]
MNLWKLSGTAFSQNHLVRSYIQMSSNVDSILKGVDFILFDALDTLYKPKTSIGYSYLAFLEKKNANPQKITEATMESNFLKSFKEVNDKSKSFGFYEGIDDGEWWKRVIRLTYIYSGVEVKVVDSLIDEATDELMKAYSSSIGYVVYPDTVSTIPKLKELGYKIGVVSNSDTRTPLVLKDMNLLSYFDFVIDSASFGVEKPSPEIFNIAMQKILNIDGKGIDKSRVLHVGDNLKKDFFGALSFGFNAALLCRPGETPNPSIKTQNDLDLTVGNFDKSLVASQKFGVISSLGQLLPVEKN